ncbi:MAG: bifunctional 4-hydroxy-2-oxoglutarate aldolase/2-dehydro-3-deoxy-phosphogluconate aldolase [Candidatus Didemnitutus sp.]|nr:bifunctional 4-hydroxy-2-oxoglutarate aldolase/2-dehydro-3-deoxy-phosphogluconate aldolase [Candidatus Didemnitutus sp.]
MNKSDVLHRIRSEKVIALIRADGPDSLIDCARALAAGGLSVIELTMTTPGALAVLAQAAKELPDVVFGMGTVLDAQTVAAAQAAGAKFIVTPAVRPTVLAACQERGLAVLGGALTPTEAYTSYELGADVIKIFPAEYFGPAYIKSIKAPFPHLNVMPTGGVTPETVADFLKAGAFATAAGSSLVQPAALKAKDWAAITARAREFVAAAAKA